MLRTLLLLLLKRRSLLVNHYANATSARRRSACRKERLTKFRDWMRNIRMDHDAFQALVRLTPTQFDQVLSSISPLRHIRVSNYTLLDSELFFLFLLYSCGGGSLRFISAFSGVNLHLMSNLLRFVANSIISKLSHNLTLPRTQAQWLSIRQQFLQQYQFPCYGSIDGCHISIVAPSKTGSVYFNYKKYFSIVLMAVVDSQCRFIFVDCGSPGRHQDNTIFENTSFFTSLCNNSLNLPPPLFSINASEPVHSFFVADGAFRSSIHIVKPYRRPLNVAQKQFSYRVSRARRVVENCFVILKSRFRVLLRPLDLEVSFAPLYVHSLCILHNTISESVDIPLIPIRSAPCTFNQTTQLQYLAKHVTQEFIVN